MEYNIPNKQKCNAIRFVTQSDNNEYSLILTSVSNNSFIQSEMTSNIQSTNQLINQSIDKSIINNKNHNNHHQHDDFKLGSILKTLLEGALMRKWGGGGVHKKKTRI